MKFVVCVGNKTSFNSKGGRVTKIVSAFEPDAQKKCMLTRGLLTLTTSLTLGSLMFD